jgi:hypothetical protein
MDTNNADINNANNIPILGVQSNQEENTINNTTIAATQKKSFRNNKKLIIILSIIIIAILIPTTIHIKSEIELYKRYKEYLKITEYASQKDIIGFVQYTSDENGNRLVKTFEDVEQAGRDGNFTIWNPIIARTNRCPIDIQVGVYEISGKGSLKGTITSKKQTIKLTKGNTYTIKVCVGDKIKIKGKIKFKEVDPSELPNSDDDD